MADVLMTAHPHIGRTTATTLATYMLHVRKGHPFSTADQNAMHNAIRMSACHGLYGAEMENNSEEWFMLRKIMHIAGLTDVKLEVDA
jgi:hypothetical protein